MGADHSDQSLYYGRLVSQTPATQILSMPQLVFLFFIDDSQQPNSKDTQNDNEKCREDGRAAPTME